MMLLPVRRLRVDDAGASLSSSSLMDFGYERFEPATYTRSQLTYPHQSGHKVVYGEREELVADLVDFSASDYASLRSFGAVDVEITMGLPGATATVVTFLSTRLELAYNVTEGVQKLKLTALQISTASGTVVPVTVADFGYGSGNPSGNRFSMALVDARVGMELIKLPYRNGEYMDVERVVGFKRSAELTVSPLSLQGERQGFGGSIEAWILSDHKFLRMYNFFGESEGVDSYREVVVVQEEVAEERIENLMIGRNLVLVVKDKYKQSV